MVRTKPDEGDKQRGRPRGKPFEKGNQNFKKRKSETKAILASGREISVEGGVVAPTPQSLAQEPLNTEKSILSEMPKKVIDTTNQILKESMETPATIESFPPSEIEKAEDDKKAEIIESIDFFNGNNKVSIRLSKRHNRMFQIKIFLNDETEVRPMTYTGARTGYMCWNLLKGSLKK
jgi:hypothetical protein